MTLSQIDRPRLSTAPPRLRKRTLVWDGTAVPMERFGSDHWAMLMTWPADVAFRRMFWQEGPTIVRDAELWGHTDLDVLGDLAAAGLLEHVDEARMSFSARGLEVRAALVRHCRQRGGNYANFDPPAAGGDQDGSEL